MHRDPTLRKRNALVIPGVLIALACLVGIVYAQALRPDTVECEDGKMVVFAGACRSATLLLVIPLAIGALLIGLGAAKRSSFPCHLGHGTVASTVLAVLVAAVLLPAIASLYVASAQDPDDPYVVTVGDVDYTQSRLLGGAAAAMLVVLLPYLGLYLATARPRRCCREKSCFEPCFCDEEAAPPIPTFPGVPPAHPKDNAQVTTTAWTGPPAREVKPLPPPPRAAPAGAATAAAPVAAETPPSGPPAPTSGLPTKELVHDAWPESPRTMAAAAPEASPQAEEPEAEEDEDEGKKSGGRPTKKARKVTRARKK